MCPILSCVNLTYYEPPNFPLQILSPSDRVWGGKNVAWTAELTSETPPLGPFGNQDINIIKLAPISTGSAAKQRAKHRLKPRGGIFRRPVFWKLRDLKCWVGELWVWLKNLQSHLKLGVLSGMERTFNYRQYISTNATSIMSLFMFDRLKTIKPKTFTNLLRITEMGFSRVFNWCFLGQFQRFRRWIAIFHQWHNCSDCLWFWILFINPT